MLSEKMEKALNDQINEELYSAYLYLSMSAWFQAQNLKGFAKWMAIQFTEEQKHAQKFYDYIYDRLGAVKLQAIKEPPSSWSSPLAAYEDSFKHEQHITDRINMLYDMAGSDKDRATQEFLNWFVKEQVEEEASVDEYVQLLKIVGGNAQGLYLINKQAGARGGD